MNRIYNPVTKRYYPVRPKTHSKETGKIKGLWSKNDKLPVASSREKAKGGLDG